MADRPFNQSDLDVLAQWDTPTICNGLEITNPERRRAWFGSYILTILERDVRDIAQIDNLAALPRVLTLIAARVGSLEVSASIPCRKRCQPRSVGSSSSRRAAASSDLAGSIRCWWASTRPSRRCQPAVLGPV